MEVKAGEESISSAVKVGFFEFEVPASPQPKSLSFQIPPARRE
jgi:hypothetical protein